MIAVIFEVWPAEGARQSYLDIAAALRADLVQIDGFISVERFQSLTDPDKMLSLSFWRDEDAIRQWRNLPNHRQAQGKGRGSEGRDGMFSDYRLRIAEVARDYGLTERAQAPGDSRQAHAPAGLSI